LCKSIAKKQDAPFSRPFGATENDAQKLHALWLLPMIVVRNTAHEVLCGNTPHSPRVRSRLRFDGMSGSGAGVQNPPYLSNRRFYSMISTS
ncbi:MAG: hypothetical protein PUC62_04710, partial [Oscillospiraceae bacterium]|nr:hypothetical protein [Oscillospiraceae bacterium]